MKKMKAMLLVIVFAFVLLIATTISNADVSVTREVQSNGSINFTFTGLNLDTNKEYQFGATANQAADVENWYDISNYDTNSAVINYNMITSSLKSVFNKSDTGYITIKEKNSSNEPILNHYAVDLKIPFLKVTNMQVLKNGTKFNSGNQQDCINVPLRNAGNSKAYFKYEKITDENVINKFKEIKDGNGNYFELDSFLISNPQDAGWNEWRYWNGYGYGDAGYGNPENIISVSDEGLYYMWVLFRGSNIKDVYGCILIDNLSNNQGSQEQKSDGSESGTSNGKTQSAVTSNSGTSTAGKSTDTTTATSIIPYAGKRIIIISLVAVITVLAITIKAKYNNYKDIK